ncbi:MAG: DUF4194 domain-containing protein [Spirochaetaceae bacterium]|jgi:hypothetical protein|nr:DUF4194 domain-containing protein [Spirochaetaceae bacterium]
MLEEYEKLNSGDKEDFRRLANYLLSHTYMVRDEYQPSRQMTLPARDYQIVSRLFGLFKEYFDLSGWGIERDDNYGVISLYSRYDHNRFRLDRFTTLFLYMCRLIYEEKREDAGSYRNVIPTSTTDVVERMRTYGLLERGKTGKETTKKERIEAQRTLAHFNIIRKVESSPWDGEGNRILILPSILSIITNQGLNDIYREIQEMAEEGGAAEYAADSGDADGDAP